MEETRTKKRTLDEIAGDDDAGPDDQTEGRAVKQKKELTVETASAASATITASDSGSGSNKFYGDGPNEDKSLDSSNSCKGGMGFLAYAKINPFAAAAAIGAGNAFGAEPQPSPKNPFSTTSPKHNPFMSFVDKKEEFWKIMSTNPSLANSTSMFGFNSETSQNTIINSRSDATETESKAADIAAGTPAGAAKKIQFGVSSDAPGSANSSKTSSEKSNSRCNSPVSENGSDASPAKLDDSEADTPNTDSYVVANGEEGEECVFQVRAKLFRLGNRVITAQSDVHNESKFSSVGGEQKSTETITNHKVENKNSQSEEKAESEGKDSSDAADAKPAADTKPATAASAPLTEWIEVGTGPLRILMPSVTTEGGIAASNPRVVMRREFQPGGHGTKLILNELLQSHSAVSKIGDKAVRLTVVSMVDKKAQPVSYLFKTKMTSETDKLEMWMTDLLPNAK